ncbi:MAG TPA: ABC transporter substrate-binding protein [Gemmatimonadales bacterium]|nr:ABC transporter substrate-binding protein [Gemmatimonadales bacterium]
MRAPLWLVRVGLVAFPSLVPLLTRSPQAQGVPADHGTIVIAVGTLATLPVPTVITGRWNQDVSDLLFLKLARLGPELATGGDKRFVPQLAKSWTRRDSLTLVFELDPRARWHDGTPVTSRDVVFTFRRTLEPGVDPQRALLLRYLASVTEEGPQRVVFRFSRAYSEQLYDAVYHVQPLPAHLADSIPYARFATSSFAQHPIGNGPYKWVALVPGQRLELVANPDFFLGAPKLDRVVFVEARDPEAQLNLVLSGTADALENVVPVTNIPRVAENPSFRMLQVPSFTVSYLLFNQLSRSDRSLPHPILADSLVRLAIALALDRATLVKNVFGDYGAVPYGPVAILSWVRDPKVKPLAQDTARARALLRSRGWVDTNSDGILERNGVPLVLDLNYPVTSAPRKQMALGIQEQLRRIGIKVELVGMEGAAWNEARNRHDFDIDFSSVGLDPSPAGLIQSWSCEGLSGTNVGGYCDPRVDSLLNQGIFARKDALPIWRRAVQQIEQDVPAVFIYAPIYAFAVHRRYAHVNIRPEGWWAALGEWSVTPGQQLERDRASP